MSKSTTFETKLVIRRKYIWDFSTKYEDAEVFDDTEHLAGINYRLAELNKRAKSFIDESFFLIRRKVETIVYETRL